MYRFRKLRVYKYRRTHFWNQQFPIPIFDVKTKKIRRSSKVVPKPQGVGVNVSEYEWNAYDGFILSSSFIQSFPRSISRDGQRTDLKEERKELGKQVSTQASRVQPVEKYATALHVL